MSRWYRVMVVTALVGGLASIASGPVGFAAESTGYFPQVVDGRATPTTYYTTEFVFNNAQAMATVVTLRFFSDRGLPWVVDLRSYERGDAAGNRSSTTFTLQPYETANFYTGYSGDLATGWAKVESSRSVLASSSFTLFRAGSPPLLLWRAAVLPAPAATQVAIEANVSPFRDVFDGISTDTGFAIANPSGADATITVTLLARWGNPPAAVRYLSVPQGGHTAVFLSQVFDDLYWGNTFHGTVRFSSNVAISMVALKRAYGAGNDIYSSVPVQPEADLKRNIVWDTENNNTIALAQPIVPPAEIIGTSNFSDDATDSDFFAINLLAGQTLYAFVLAETIGSPFDGSLELLDVNYNQVAGTDNTPPVLNDPLLNHTIVVTGTYYLRCRSTTWSAARGAFYRLFVKVK